MQRNKFIGQHGFLLNLSKETFHATNQVPFNSYNAYKNRPSESANQPFHHAIFQIAYYDIYQYISKTEPNNLFGTSRCYFQTRSINEVFFLWQASVQSLQSVYVVIRRDEKKECL